MGTDLPFGQFPVFNFFSFELLLYSFPIVLMISFAFLESVTFFKTIGRSGAMQSVAECDG